MFLSEKKTDNLALLEDDRHVHLRVSRANNNLHEKTPDDSEAKEV